MSKYSDNTIFRFSYHGNCEVTGMKKVFLCDLVIVLLSWILFLNGIEILSASVLLSAALGFFLLGYYRRPAEAAIIVFAFVSLCFFFLSSGQIEEFFPLSRLFFIGLSFHIALIYELLPAFSREELYPFLLLVSSLFFLFFLIAVFLPEEWYTLFSKMNLYILIILIYLPHILLTILTLYEKEWELLEARSFPKEKIDG